MTWSSTPICKVCGRDLGGTKIDHTACFDRALARHMKPSPVKGMDFRVEGVMVVDSTREPSVRVDDSGAWDVSVQDEGRTLKLFKRSAPDA